MVKLVHGVSECEIKSVVDELRSDGPGIDRIGDCGLGFEVDVLRVEVESRVDDGDDECHGALKPAVGEPRFKGRLVEGGVTLQLPHNEYSQRVVREDIVPWSVLMPYVSMSNVKSCLIDGQKRIGTVHGMHRGFFYVRLSTELVKQRYKTYFGTDGGVFELQEAVNRQSEGDRTGI